MKRVSALLLCFLFCITHLWSHPGEGENSQKLIASSEASASTAGIQVGYDIIILGTKIAYAGGIAIATSETPADDSAP